MDAYRGLPASSADGTVKNLHIYSWQIKMCSYTKPGQTLIHFTKYRLQT